MTRSRCSIFEWHANDYCGTGTGQDDSNTRGKTRRWRAHVRDTQEPATSPKNTVPSVAFSSAASSEIPSYSIDVMRLDARLVLNQFVPELSPALFDHT